MPDQNPHTCPPLPLASTPTNPRPMAPPTSCTTPKPILLASSALLAVSSSVSPPASDDVDGPPLTSPPSPLPPSPAPLVSLPPSHPAATSAVLDPSAHPISCPTAVHPAHPASAPDAPEHTLLALVHQLRDASDLDAALDVFQSASAQQLCPPFDAVGPSLVMPVFDVMLCHPKHEGIQVVCVTLLARMAEMCEATAMAVAEGKGVQLLVHTLLHHKGSAPVARGCVTALTAVLRVVPGYVDVCVEYFGVEVVVGAAKVLVEEEELQMEVMRLLQVVGRADEGGDTGAGNRRAGEARAALRVLKRWRGNVELSREACVLLRMVMEKAGREEVEQLGRIGTVRMVAMVAVLLREEEAVQRDCLAVLCVMVRMDGYSLRQLAQLRAVEMVLRTMRRFRGCGEVQRSAVELLRRLADYDETQVALMFASGVMEAMLSLMIERAADVWIQRECVAVLDRLVYFKEEARLRLIKIGGDRLVTESLAAHIRNEEYVEEGARTLQYILWRDDLVD